jgi:DNA modification methylase
MLQLILVKGSVSNKSVNHQAVQPNYLPEKYILACTSEGDIVLDPWVGSGTTGIVALLANRRVYWC